MHLFQQPQQHVLNLTLHPIHKHIVPASHQLLMAGELVQAVQHGSHALLQDCLAAAKAVGEKLRPGLLVIFS